MNPKQDNRNEFGYPDQLAKTKRHKENRKKTRNEYGYPKE